MPAWPLPRSPTERLVVPRLHTHIFTWSRYPSPGSTPEHWLQMIQFWTVLREQLVGGAPRRARNETSQKIARLGAK